MVAMRADSPTMDRSDTAPGAGNVPCILTQIPPPPHAEDTANMAIYLTEAQISELLTMDDTLIVLEELFAARARGEIVNRPRVRVPITGGHLQRDAGELAGAGRGRAEGLHGVRKGRLVPDPAPRGRWIGPAGRHGRRADQRPAYRRGDWARGPGPGWRGVGRTSGRDRRRLPGDDAGQRHRGGDGHQGHPRLEPHGGQARAVRGAHGGVDRGRRCGPWRPSRRRSMGRPSWSPSPTPRNRCCAPTRWDRA